MQPRVIMFDLDGTLAESKQPLDAEMADLLLQLLEKHYVGVISGGSFNQFQKQFLGSFPEQSEKFANLILLPTSGASMYRYRNNEWHKEYQELIPEAEAQKIITVLKEASASFNYPLETPYGPTIENRGSQITISPLGQHAPITEKTVWDPNQEKRKEMVRAITPQLPDCTITIGGMTSIDITAPGVDKAYGVHKLSETLHIPISEMLFVGDALFEGGNDYPAQKSGISCREVKTIEETKELIRSVM